MCPPTPALSNARCLMVVRRIEQKRRNEVGGWVGFKKSGLFMNEPLRLLFGRHVVNIHNGALSWPKIFPTDPNGAFEVFNVSSNTRAIKRTLSDGRTARRTKKTQWSRRVSRIQRIHSIFTLSLCPVTLDDFANRLHEWLYLIAKMFLYTPTVRRNFVEYTLMLG